MENLAVLKAQQKDPTGRIVARARADSAGHDWNAFLYATNATGTELTYVGHAAAQAYGRLKDQLRTHNAQALQAAKGRIKSLEGDLAAARAGLHDLKRSLSPQLPSGQKVRLAPAHPCPEINSTSSALEQRVGAAIALTPLTARSVAQALRPFENISAVTLQATRLADISECYKSLRPTYPRSKEATIFYHVDAFEFGKGKPVYTRNSIQQVASQFNFLESPSPDHAELSTYASDRTQGPYASLGCPGALVARNACFKHQRDGEIQPFFEDFPESYERGYFEPLRVPEDRRTQALTYAASHSGDLRVLAQTGRSVFGPTILQIFTAAPSFQGQAAPPLATSKVGQICTIMVSAQYAALGQLAALHSERTGARVPLHVTLVGQGAFKNPVAVMAVAFQELLEAVKGFDVVLYFHAWSKEDEGVIRSALAASGVDSVPLKLQDEFFP